MGCILCEKKKRFILLKMIKLRMKKNGKGMMNVQWITLNYLNECIYIEADLSFMIFLADFHDMLPVLFDHLR